MDEPETRIVVCHRCGGDGGRDVPYGVNYIDGSLLTRWRPCEWCSGVGEVEVVVVPIEIEDLDD